MKQSKVMIFPTDTVYGIGCRYDDLDGINKIYEIKRRDLSKALPILFSSYNQIKELVYLNKDFFEKAKAFWPGPLTVIVKTKNKLKSILNEETIAIRMPKNDNLLKLIDILGPLRATSLNDSNQEPIKDFELIIDKYENLVDDIFYYEHELSNTPSTIVDITKEEIEVIRKGEITKEQIVKLFL